MTILTALPCIVGPEVRRYWEFGLVDCWAVVISAGSEVHQRLLSLLAQYPCRANEPRRCPQSEPAAACEADGERGTPEAEDMQAEQWLLEATGKYKKSLRTLLLWKWIISRARMR